MTMVHIPNPSAPSFRLDLFEAGEAQDTSGTTPTGSGGNSPPLYLTPDAIMAYCQSRLQSIDGQVETAMTQQQNCNSEQSAVQGVLNEIGDLQSQLSGTPPVVNAPASAVKIEGDLESLISQMETTDPTNSQIATLKQLFDTIMATSTGPNKNGAQMGFYNGSTAAPGSPPNGTAPAQGVNNDEDGTFGSDELTNFSQTLTGVNNALNNSAELGMINIQSLMSQRTTAIQLSTNILQSMDDGMSKIVDNVGH
jgi:hypothetical protein